MIFCVPNSPDHTPQHVNEQDIVFIFNCNISITTFGFVFVCFFYIFGSDLTHFSNQKFAYEFGYVDLSIIHGLNKNQNKRQKQNS